MCTAVLPSAYSRILSFTPCKLLQRFVPHCFASCPTLQTIFVLIFNRCRVPFPPSKHCTPQNSCQHHQHECSIFVSYWAQPHNQLIMMAWVWAVSISHTALGWSERKLHFEKQCVFLFSKPFPSKSVKERKGERSLALHECLANSAEHVKNKISKANHLPVSWKQATPNCVEWEQKTLTFV